MLTLQTADCQCAACQALRRASRRTGVKRKMPREPTVPMLNAAREWSDKKYGKPIGNDAATGCWQAMFDAATLED